MNFEFTNGITYNFGDRLFNTLNIKYAVIHHERLSFRPIIHIIKMSKFIYSDNKNKAKY